MPCARFTYLCAGSPTLAGCERIVVMGDGRAIQAGTPTPSCSRSVDAYAQLWASWSAGQDTGVTE